MRGDCPPLDTDPVFCGLGERYYYYCYYYYYYYYYYYFINLAFSNGRSYTDFYP